MSPPDSSESSSDASDPEASPDSERGVRGVVGMGLLAEGILGLVGWAGGLWSGVDWAALAQPTGASVLLGVLGGLGLVGLHLLLVLPGRDRNPLYRTIFRPLWRILHPRLQNASLLSLVALALASGVGEEVLFRGWLQTEIGLGAASLLFGAAHVWGREALPYGLYAAGMGAGLGGLFAATGSLWAPALAHALNNLLGFLALRNGWLAPSSASVPNRRP